ncbi:hypothetical protein [Vulcanisaeta thermophila]|uniref:hypothetical protein n=1 Tax=Vulcanisaeta thermophila TaxID=867917 RepID=UPI001180FDBF|nr:hypothetical protein [Vulcanisaeta thermophila]
MDVKSLVKLLGALGFVTYNVTLVLVYYYVVLPIVIPIIIKNVESTLASEGIAVSQSEISSIAGMIRTDIMVLLPIAIFIGWLIISAVLLGLLRAFKLKIGFTDTWLTVGNYFYIITVYQVIITLPPLLTYIINSVITHVSPLTQPPILAINVVTMVISSLLLAYILNKVYQLSFVRAFVASLIALLIWLAIPYHS